MRVILSENLEDIERWVFPDVNKLKSVDNEHHQTHAMSLMAPDTQDNNEVDLQVECGEDIFERAQKDGYEAGYEEGVKKAYAAAETRAQTESDAKHDALWQEKLNALSRMLEQLNKPAAMIDEEVEKNLVVLTMELTKRIFVNELQIKPEQVLSIVRKAATVLPVSDMNVSLFVHPEDLSLIKEVLKGERYSNIEADENLQRGDCRFKTEGGEVDASFEKRLDNIAQQVFKDVG